MTAISWLTAHWALIAGTITVVINEVIAWVPSLKGNSILQVFLGLVNVGPGAPAAVAAVQKPVA